MQEGLPDAVRGTQERILASLRVAATDQLSNKREQKLAKKYHMVKFFG